MTTMQWLQAHLDDVEAVTGQRGPFADQQRQELAALAACLIAGDY